MTRDAWDPAQYERFRREREQPFFDLLALVEARDGMRVVDLGCGTGAPTRVLHERLHARETLGVDNSPAMLARAAEVAGSGLRFVAADIATFTAGAPFDVVFSNAALHWVPDHPALLARLATLLAPGGQLAVQVPANGDHATHVIAAAVAGEEPFRSALRGTRAMPGVLPPEAYASLLDRLGFERQIVRLEVYPHRLPGRDDVVEWVKGTLLTMYESLLPGDLFQAFLARYRERLLPELADTHPHFYPFKRILFWARR